MGAISIAPKKGESGNSSKLLSLSISKKNHCSKGVKKPAKLVNKWKSLFVTIVSSSPLTIVLVTPYCFPQDCVLFWQLTAEAVRMLQNEREGGRRCKYKNSMAASAKEVIVNMCHWHTDF